MYVKSKWHFSGFVFFVFFTGSFCGMLLGEQNLKYLVEIIIGGISAYLWYGKAFGKIKSNPGDFVCGPGNRR